MSKKDAIPNIPIERLANAIAAIESIAQNNKQLLEHHYNTDASDVMSVTMLARAHWYDMNKRNSRR